MEVGYERAGKEGNKKGRGILVGQEGPVSGASRAGACGRSLRGTGERVRHGRDHGRVNGAPRKQGGKKPNSHLRVETDLENPAR